MWWATHVVQFPHVSFIAHQVLGIVGSQIETKRIFIITNVTMNLRWSWLGIDNLDCLILVQNWLNDVHLGCVGTKEKTSKHFLTFEKTLIEEHKKLIEKQGLLKKI